MKQRYMSLVRQEKNFASDVQKMKKDREGFI